MMMMMFKVETRSFFTFCSLLHAMREFLIGKSDDHVPPPSNLFPFFGLASYDSASFEQPKCKWSVDTSSVI